MPIKESAAKALRQTKKHTECNKKAKANIAWLKRKFLKAFAAKDKKQMADLYLKLQKSLDKMFQKGILKKNTVARTKSRLMDKINGLAK